jgi:AP-4 complex subunit beta-1
MVPCVRAALKETAPYVVNAAIMGHLKVFYTKPDTFEGDTRLGHDLYNLIRNIDPVVSANSLVALDEMLQGGVVVTYKMVTHLLARIKDYNEWGQAVVLGVIARYSPRNDNEMFEIMNAVDDRLKKNCSAVVLAAVRLFLKLASSRQKIFSQVILRIASPLLTLLTSYEMAGLWEMAYLILKHILMVVECYQGQPAF